MSFFCVSLGVRADIKISAVEKLLRVVNGDCTVKFLDMQRVIKERPEILI